MFKVTFMMQEIITILYDVHFIRKILSVDCAVDAYADAIIVPYLELEFY